MFRFRRSSPTAWKSGGFTSLIWEKFSQHSSGNVQNTRSLFFSPCQFFSSSNNSSSFSIEKFFSNEIPSPLQILSAAVPLDDSQPSSIFPDADQLSFTCSCSPNQNQSQTNNDDNTQKLMLKKEEKNEGKNFPTSKSSWKVCPHQRIQHQCRECRGAGICEHGKRKSYCKKCCGSGRCEHGKIRYYCKQCEGEGICAHGKFRQYCKKCHGSAFCQHGTRRRYCKKCGGSGLCPHQRPKHICKHCCPVGYATFAMRSSVLNALWRPSQRGSEKSDRTLRLLGCSSFEELRKHFSSQFKSDMNWSNHGSTWHIDHRRPCASFNLQDANEQRMCFHYTNLQPMYAEENLSKGKFYDADTFGFEWKSDRWVPKQQVMSLGSSKKPQ